MKILNLYTKEFCTLNGSLVEADSKDNADTSTILMNWAIGAQTA